MTTHSCIGLDDAIKRHGMWAQEWEPKGTFTYSIDNDEYGYHETITFCPFCGVRIG